MTLAILLASVISLDNESFYRHETKIVKFFAPWCGHCKAFAPEYERLSELTDMVVAEVDCDAHKALCQDNDVEGFPTVKFFYESESYDYQGARQAESIIEFTTEMKLPPLYYSDEIPSYVVWFEYFTDMLDEDQHLFEGTKGKITVVTRRGDRNLIAHIDQLEIAFHGNYLDSDIQHFISQYMYGLFPELDQSIMSSVRNRPIAIYIHSSDEEVYELAKLTLDFNRNAFFYSHMDAEKYQMFASAYGCNTTPCALVFGEKEEFSSPINSFEEFYPFIERVHKGEVSPLERPVGTHAGALLRLKWRAQDFLEGKSQIVQALYVALAIVLLGSIIVIPVTICVARWYFSRDGGAQLPTPEKKSADEAEAFEPITKEAEEQSAQSKEEPIQPKEDSIEPQEEPVVKEQPTLTEVNVVKEPEEAPIVPVPQRGTKRSIRVE